jgi:hypothetical protein
MDINAYVQAAALCQYQQPVNHTEAFRAITLACGGSKRTNHVSDVCVCVSAFLRLRVCVSACLHVCVSACLPWLRVCVSVCLRVHV